MNLGWIQIRKTVGIILILQFIFAGNSRFGIAIERPDLPQNAQPEPPHEFPEDIQRILQKIQTCADLPVCENPEVPVEARGNLRVGVPIQCQLTSAEETRLSDYFASLRIVSEQAIVFRLFGSLFLGPIVGITFNEQIGPLLFRNMEFGRHLNALSSFIIAFSLIYVPIRTWLSFITQENLDRAIHRLEVNPTNVERVLTRIPRRSWVRRLLTSAGQRLTQAPRVQRLTSALTTLAARSTPTVSTASVPTPALANPAPAPANPNSTSSSDPGMTTSTMATPPSGVRVCVPEQAINNAATFLADETLLELEEEAATPAGPRQAVAGSGVGESRVVAPSPIHSPSGPTNSRRRVLCDERPESRGAMPRAVDASTVLPSAPALLPAPTAAGAAATESMIPVPAP